MRPGLDAGTLALYQSGQFALHTRLRVANGSGTLQDLQGRYTAWSLTLPTASAPIGSLRVDFLREIAADGTDSLAPFVRASALNRLDDGVTYAPLLEYARLVTLDVALTALGGARPADGAASWYEVFRGNIAKVSWPEREGRIATILCNDQSWLLTKVKSETAFSYAAGISYETAIQQVLTNHGFGSITLNTPIPTGKVLGATYEPGLQKTAWEQVWGLAQAFGWLLWWRYQADGTAKLTLFEPARDKTAADMTVAELYDYKDFGVDPDKVRNVGYCAYYDTAGAQQMVGPLEDAASIAKYGGVRQPFWISFGPTSPVRTAAAANAVVAAALSDSADPEAVASAFLPPLLFAECAVDLYTFPADLRFSDEDLLLAPIAVTIDERAESDPTSTVQLEGKPSAGYLTWLGRDELATRGEPTPAYRLITGAAAIQRSEAGDYTPSSLALSAKSGTGTSAPVPYAGRFVVESTINGTDWTVRYASAGDEFGTAFVPPADIKAVRVRLYLAGGTSTLLDEEIVPVVHDGTTGPAGSSDPTCQITQPYIPDGEDVGFDAEVTYLGYLGTGGVGPLEWRTKYDAGWSAWSTAPLPVTTTVRRHAKNPRTLYLEVREQGKPAVVARDSVTIAGKQSNVRASGHPRPTTTTEQTDREQGSYSGVGGVPGNYRHVVPIYDGEGLQVLIDTETGRVGDALLALDGFALESVNGSQTKATAAQQAAESYADARAQVAIDAAAGAQATADGKVTTFFQTGAPTAEAVGDLWIDTDNDNALARWSGTAWEPVRDAGIQQAITAASDAQSTADGKIVSFYQPTPPTAGSVGDLWTDTDDNNQPYRWDGATWVSLRDGTIAIAQTAASQAITAAAAAQGTADGKVQTFFATTPPTAEGIGDLWIDTDDGNRLYRWSGSVWEDVQDDGIAAAILAAETAQNTADGKITSYYQAAPPLGASLGDLWIDTDQGNRIHWWDGAAWIDVADGTVVRILPPTCSLSQPYVADGESVTASATVTYIGALGVGGAPPLQWRTRYGSAWSGWSTTPLPYTTTVPRHPTHARLLELEVQDAGGNPATASTMIAPRMPVLSPTGHLDPAQPYEGTTRTPRMADRDAMRGRTAMRPAREQDERSGFGGAPGALVNSLPVTDAAGLQVLIDTETGSAGSALKAPGGTALGVVENGANKAEAAMDPDGNLLSTVMASDGASAKVLPKGAVSGTVRNGQTIVFSETRNSPPIIIFSGGATDEGRAKWGSPTEANQGTAVTARPTNVMVKQSMTADVSVSAFTAHLHLIAKAAPGQRTAAFAAPTTVTFLNTGTGAATPATGDVPSASNAYLASFEVVADNGLGLTDTTVSIEVVAEVSLNGGLFSEVASKWIGFGVAAGQVGGAFGSITIPVSGVAGGDDHFRLVAKSFTSSGGKPSFERLTVDPNLSWYFDAAALHASMTPDGDADAVTFFVVSAG